MNNRLLPQFDLDNEAAYQQWREQKLQDYPTAIEQLIVEVKDPTKLSDAEREAMLQRILKSNMVVFAGPTGDDPDKTIPRQLGAQFGLQSLDNNTGADDDGITSLEVKNDEWHKHYIPYTDRQIHWHTDGYYNDLTRQIFGLQLHCVRAAAEGGKSSLMDHEIAYILLRDRDPALVEALMREDAMTIPENRADDKVDRPERPGPVFMAGARWCIAYALYGAQAQYRLEQGCTHAAGGGYAKRDSLFRITIYLSRYPATRPGPD